MALFEIQGGRRLEGEISLQGAKNGALPIMAASLLPENGISVISNCPNLSDVHITCSMLDSLGCTCRYRNHVLTVDATSANRFVIDDQMMRRMRSSVLFLGALLSRFGQAEISAPGGCELGLRPIDLHLDAFRRMGAVINEEHGRFFAVPKMACTVAPWTCRLQASARPKTL